MMINQASQDVEFQRCEWLALCPDRGECHGHLPPHQQGPRQDSLAGGLVVENYLNYFFARTSLSRPS